MQVISDLAPHFQVAYGYDRSTSQLEHAKRSSPNITYAPADAYSIPLEDGCADMVTVSSSMGAGGQ